MWGLKDSSGNPFNEHAFSNYGSMQEEIQAHMSDYLLGSTPIETWRQAYEADVVLVVTLAGVLGNSAGAAGVATPPGFNPNLAVLDAVMGGWPGDPNFRFLLIHEILHLLGLTHEEDGGVDHVNQTCTVMATPCPSGYTRTTDIVPMAKVIAATGLLRLADLHENGGAPGSGSGGGGFPPDDTPGPVSLYGFVYDCTPGYAITSSSFSPVVQPPVSHYYFSLLGDQNSASYELTITLHPYYFGPMMEQSWPITWGGIVGPGSHDIYANWPGDVTVETRAFSSLGTPGPWTDAYVSATCFSVETG
jgi:hypothetical protein